MRKFKVVKCPQVKQVNEPKSFQTEGGAWVTVKNVREIKAGEKGLNGETWYPGAYGHRAIKNGDVLEIGGHLADKAANNPDFEEVFEKKVEEPVKRKPGRPRKVSNAA